MPSACPLCTSERSSGSWAGVTRFLGRDFRYRTCSDCRSLHCDPMPDNEVLEAMYGPEYPELVAADHDVEDPKAPGHVLDLARSRPPGRFVDFGCGDGALLAAMASAGWDVVGIEFDSDVARAVAARTGLRVITVAEAEDEAVDADMVNLGDVIEHLTEPDSTFRAALGMLGTDGVLVAQGPLENGRTVFGAIMRTVGRLRPDRIREGIPAHVILATEAGQRAFFQRHGLVTERFEVSEVWWPAPQTIAACRRRPRLLVIHLARRLSLTLGSILPGTCGDRYFYVGRRAATD